MRRLTQLPFELLAKLVALAASVSIFACHAPGQAKPATAEVSTEWAHQSSDLPSDARIQYGALDNGVRWAWAAHPEPQKRVYLRLHVNVGSLSETESERGMAHFLEHMAFNGSENFAAGTLIEWFQEQGMSFGADTNAHTSFSETVYKLDLPENDVETLREGMLVLRDFAAGLTLADEEVQAEKGVIDGEERERDSAGFRAFVEMLGKQYAGTLYAARLPIGTKEARDVFDAESVRAFYQKWYRPENLSLVVVGDLGELDPSELIGEYFGNIPVPKTPVAIEPDSGSPSFEEPFLAVQNRELPTMQLSLAQVRPKPELADSQAERVRQLTRGLAHAMVNLRYSELVKEPDAPYLGASLGEAGEFDLLTGGNLDVVSTPENFGEALEAAYVEVRRALNFGFRQEELDEVRADWLRGIDEAVERDATAPSAGLREAILLEIEEGFVPTSTEFDRELFRPALLALTVDDCLQALREEWRGGTLTVSCVGPIEIVDPADIFGQIVTRAKERKIQASVEVARREWAYSSEGRVYAEPAEEVEHEATGSQLVRFQNGVLLNLKQTDFRDKEVMVSIRVGRGALALPQGRADLMMLAGPLYSGGGLVEHSSDDLRRLTAGKQVGAGFAIGEDAFQFGGATTAEDLLFQLELMQAMLESPGYRPDLLPLIQSQIPLIFEQFQHSAQGPLLLDFLPKLLLEDDRATLLGFQLFPSQESLAAMDMETLKAALAGPLAEAPIEITIVGDVDPEEVKLSVGRTFGTMPARESLMLPAVMPQAKVAVGLQMTREIDTEDEIASLILLFPTTDGIDDRTRRHISFLGSVVDDRMRLRVREELGAAYSPSAGAGSSQTWLGLGAIMIQAAGEPAGAQDLLEASLGVAAELAESGVTQEEIDRLVAPVLKQLRDARRTNAYWLDALTEAQSNPRSLEASSTVLTTFENLEIEFLNELARRYLAPERGSYLLVLPSSSE
jgi:zinc protease